MNTGICKSLILGLTVATLSACTDGGELGFLQSSSKAPSATAPLTQAQMMRGAVTLVPSSGYCIDPKTLKQNFALLARCDTLGGTNGALDAPLGVMTVSIAATQGTPLTLESVAPVITKRVDADGFAAAKATTDTPAAGLAKSHWRAVTTLNAHDLSIALFAPAGSAALGDEGLRMIAGLIANSQSASVATSVATDLQPKVTPAKKGLAATFAGLFK